MFVVQINKCGKGNEKYHIVVRLISGKEIDLSQKKQIIQLFLSDIG